MSLDLDQSTPSSDDDSYQHLKHEYDHLRLLYEVSQELSSTFSLPQVLQQTLHRTTTSTGAARGSIILFDDQGAIQQHLFTERLQYATASSFTTLVVKQGLAGWVLDHGEGALVSNTELDPRWIDFPGETVDVRSAIAVPLMRGRRVRGVLTLVHPEPYFFNQDDLELLNTIAHHAVMAIENARLMAGINDERRKFEGAVTAMEEGLILVDDHGRLLFMNPQALGMFNITPPLPTTLDALSPRLTELIAAARESGENIQTEWAIPGPSRLDLSVNITYVPSLSEQKDWWTIVLHDITTLKDYDRLKSQFVANASHELRTPLANIKLYATLAEQGKPERRSEYLRTIASEAARLESLVEDLLTLSRLDSGMLPNDPKYVAVDELLVKLITTYRPLAETRAVAFNLEISSASIPPTWIDPNHLTRIVVNLLSNALKFTPAGGTISTTLSLQVHQEKPGIAIAVTDTGVGIPLEEQSHLFERFYRGKNVTIGGTGLGLTIVYELLLLAGGTIDLESTPGQGSTFTCWLPVVNPTLSDSETPQP